jgi:hypothetical protein
MTGAGDGHVVFSNFQFLHFNNAVAVDTFYGPDTADRATALAGLDANHRFVQVLYLNALGRAGTMAELDAWVSTLGTANGQMAIAAGIEHSLEARQHLVKAWYRTFLGRAATGMEITTAANGLVGGDSEAQVLSTILGGVDFFNRAQMIISGAGTANEKFIQALFLLLLNRTGSAAEVSAELQLLVTMTREQLAFNFLTGGTLATEYRTDVVDAYYEVLLHRLADSGGVFGWVHSPNDVGGIRIGFESSPEFFMNG